MWRRVVSQAASLPQAGSANVGLRLRLASADYTTYYKHHATIFAVLYGLYQSKATSLLTLSVPRAYVQITVLTPAEMAATLDQRTDDYHPKDALGDAIKATLVTGGAGLFISTIQNTLTKQNTGAWGVFTRSGSTIGVFGMLEKNQEN